MQDYHQLDIWQRAMAYTTNAEFARFLSYAYRSLKEVVTCLELCQRLYPALPTQSLSVLIDEGDQISRMTYTLMQRLGTPPDAPQPRNS